MGEVRWTQEQRKVIEARNCNLLVAAAAGSGKTAVLVERIITMITDEKNPIDIDQLLVVTFTNAAAAEMRERIAKAISDKLDKMPSNKHLYKQLTLLQRASITTIHSYCLDIIRKNFHILNIDPKFRVADQTEILLLKSDILKELLEDLYTNGDESFYDLVESYSGSKYDYPLEELILGMYNFVQSNPWPKKWLEDNVELFNISTNEEFEKTKWVKIIKENFNITLEGLRAKAILAIEICKQPYGPEKYIDNLKQDIILLDDLIAGSKTTYSNMVNSLENISFSRLGRCSKDVDEDLKQKVKNIRDDEIKAGIKDLKTKIILKPIDKIIEDLNNLYPVMQTLIKVVEEFTCRFQKAKNNKNIVDFNDIEHFALNILLEDGSCEGEIITSHVAKEERNRFVEIMIDEYQDSNLVQETILTSISREGISKPNIFMVGDVKQSIYRFRLARPELFMDKYNSYSTNDSGNYRRIDLFKNFRSREEIIDGVNFLFERLMSNYIGEMEYDDKAALYLGANYKQLEDGTTGGPIEVNLIDREIPEDLELDEELQDLSNIGLEAKIIGKRIKSLINENYFVFDKSIDGYREIKYKDIVILLRATSNWSQTIIEELMKEEIPVYADVGTGYFEAIEVKIVINLLRIIDNSHQDIPLISVLRSPLVGLTVDELVDIRTTFKEGNYFDAITEYVEGELFESELGNKINQFLECLSKWKKEALCTDLDEFVWNIYVETNFYNYVAAMPGGIQRQANLMSLIEKAIKFKESSYSGLFNFIRFIEKVCENNSDMGAAKIIGENENIVRIMSIHKSKGLEFPVVFAAGLGKQFNEMDLRKSILLHQELGMGPEFVDFNNRVSYPTIAKKALSQKIKIENLSEEMRILYVAFTRAREKLILTGTVKKLEDKIEKWQSTSGGTTQKLPIYTVYKAKTYYDWIMPIVYKAEDKEKWPIFKWSIEDTPEVETKKIDLETMKSYFFEESNKYIDEDNIKYFNDELLWAYKYMDRTALPTKITVSEVKRQSQKSLDYIEKNALEDIKKNEEIYKPAFLEEKKGFSAAEKGTIFHYVMKILDFNKINSYEQIKEQIEEMVDKNLITKEEKDTIIIDRIVKFGESNIFKRILAAEKLGLNSKEKPFVIDVPIDKIYADILNDDHQTIMVQGVIDCFFEEDGQIVIVDYKTDYCTEEMIDQIKDRYKIQLDLYKEALEKITKKTVKEEVLYLFSIDKEIII